MKNKIKILMSLFFCILIIFFSGCSLSVKNKVFQNGFVMVIFYDDQVSYNMVVYKKYEYDRKTKTVTVRQKNLFNEDVFEKFFYDPKENCIYDEEGTRYDYKGRTSDINFYNSKEKQ